MKSIRIRLLIAAAAVLLGTVLGHAQTADEAAPPPPPMHGHGDWGMGGGHRMEFFADYLNLTDAQQTQMKTILQKERASLKPLMLQMRQTHQALRAYEQGTFDEAKVRAIAAQQAQAQVELMVAETRVHNELFQVLTPEQQTKMKEMETRHEARMAKHMHQAPPAPPAEQ
jgi:Spy/CpxP family protein refolding chaperone